MRNILPVLVLAAAAVVAGCVGAHPISEADLQPIRDEEPLPPKDVGPTTYWAVRARGPMAIDGVLDEPDWDRAESVVFYVYQRNTKPISNTVGKVMWDDEYLYVGFEAEDKDLFGFQTERNSDTPRDDCLEVFFMTDPDDTAYYNFEINILGTIFDAYSPAPQFAGGPYRWSKTWDCEGLQVGIQLHGTPNDPTDVDEGWHMEIAIPFRSLSSLGGQPPKAGDRWKLHLARYDYSVYLPRNGREVTSSAQFPEGRGVNFHYQEPWPALVFVDAPPEAAGDK